MARKSDTNGAPRAARDSRRKGGTPQATDRIPVSDSPTPEPVSLEDGRAKPPPNVRSYALLERDTMALYMSFYKHTYGKSVIDRKTKEFIAIAVSLSSGCKNCLEGHLKKAIKHGATRGEISEVMAIALGVAAATIVDRSDIAAANIGLDPDRWTLEGEPEGG